VGSSDTITGTYDGTNAKFVRVEVNGEKKTLISSKDLANGQIKYYVGKDLKASDDVQIVLFDQNYQEIGRQDVVISVEQIFDIRGAATASKYNKKMLITFEDNKCTLTYNTPGWYIQIHPYFDTYFSINITDSNNNVIYDHVWKGTDMTNSNHLIGTYDVPDGSIVTMYHAEGTGHAFGTNDDDDLKPKSGHTYTYKMEKNHLVFVSAE
ncbi:immunoglobulin-like domain-containing protein, partial [Enterococcus sp. C76]|uniref:immunoglobulin-like domain-containing protein n=1 Tax=Enterococcus sp. C76 TaxID=3231334 RepID=UPI0034A041C2